MPIIKIQKRDPGFVQIDNRVVNDNRLSWKAKGVLIYLLSKPNEWQVQITDIINHSPDGESAVRSAIAELIEIGYITRRDKQSKDRLWFLLGEKTSDYLQDETPEIKAKSARFEFGCQP